jgi:hypothetical protein
MMQTAEHDEVIDEQNLDQNQGEEAENDDGEQGSDEESGQQTEGEQGSDAQGEGEGDEVVVSIGEEAPASDEEENRAPEWVRELRKTNRDKDRRIRELEQRLTTAAPANQAVVVGKKPTLEDYDYDADKFEAELTAWHERKRDADAKEVEKKRAEEAAQAAWQAKLDAYGKAKTELKVKDFQDAEELIKDTFSVTQQGVVLNGADNPALLIYALGKNPKKAKELASLSDPVKFAFAVAKLETQLKVQPKKAAPVPERQVRGSAPVAGTADQQLARLEAEADKTGDRSKVIAYRRQLRRKAA